MGYKGIFKSREKLEFHPPGSPKQQVLVGSRDFGDFGISYPSWIGLGVEIPGTSEDFCGETAGKGSELQERGVGLGRGGAKGRIQGTERTKFHLKCPGETSRVLPRPNSRCSFPIFSFLVHIFPIFFQPGEGEFGNGKRGRSFGLKTRDFGQSFQICREFSPKEPQ